MPTPDTLAGLVVQRRRKRKLTQRKLAAQIGCTVAALSNIERGKTKYVSQWMLLALHEALGISLDELVGTTPERVGRKA